MSQAPPATVATATQPSSEGSSSGPTTAGAGLSAGLRGYLCPLLLTVLVGLAYANTFSCPFILDDTYILDLLSSRWHVAPLEYLHKGWRPLFNLSMMFNYAVGGETPWGYHLFNLLVHLGATLALFGLIRQTLLTPQLRHRWERSSLPVAFTVALLWGLHPLCTEAVTYTVQRAEAMYGLFALLACYCLARATLASSRRRDLAWQAGCLLACGLGLVSKEAAIAILPLLPLYDRIFCSPSWREALRRYWPLYSGITACIILPAAVLGMAGRLFTAAFASEDISRWEYFLSQTAAIVRYLRLAFWPDGLCFNYGWPTVDGIGEVWPEFLLVAALGLATVLALWRRPALGFLGAWFFIHLAPRSSFAPRADICVEHRAYLPLAAVVATVVIGLWIWADARPTPRRRWLLAGCLAIALALGGRTLVRNHDYRSVLAIWADTARKSPDSPRAQVSLAFALAEANQREAAMAHLRRALELNPDYPEAHFQLAGWYAEAGKLELARQHYEVVALTAPKPQAALASNNLGCLLNGLGREVEAETCFRRAIRLQPRHFQAWLNLGGCLINQGRLAEAQAAFDQAELLDPVNPDLWDNRGAAFVQAGDDQRAQAAFVRALALDPNHAHAQFNLGTVFDDRGDLAAAQTAYRRAAALDAKFADPRYQLGLLALAQEDRAAAQSWFEAAIQAEPRHADSLLALGDLAEPTDPAQAAKYYQQAMTAAPTRPEPCLRLAAKAIATDQTATAELLLRQALQLDPTCLAARNDLACLLSAVRRHDEALAAFRQLVKQAPDDARLRYNFASALEDAGQAEAAEQTYRQALSIDPAHADSANNLGCLLARQGRMAEAVREFRGGLVHAPDSPDLQRNLKLALRRRQKPPPSTAEPEE